MKKLFILSAVVVLATALQAQLPTVGTSSVQFSFCTTVRDTLKPDNQCEGKTYVWRGKNITATGFYKDTTQDSYGCDSIHALDIVFASCLPEGSLPGIFSVGGGVKVRFSQGNLQYRASDGQSPNGLSHSTKSGSKQGIWRFAEKQYHWVGGTYKSKDYGNVSQDAVKSTNNKSNSTYTGWIDLFCWGNTGASYTNGSNSSTVDPWWYGSQNNNSAKYYAENNGTMANTNYDWGYFNAISNGGNATAKWRVLTKDEWTYVINNRLNNAYIAKTRAWATVEGVAGLILFPDNWFTDNGTRTDNFPSSVRETLKDCSQQTGFTANTISAIDWDNILAPAGAVFLPQTGYRNSDGAFADQDKARYWSCTSSGYSAWRMDITGTSISFESYASRVEGTAVRLVQNYVAQ